MSCFFDNILSALFPTMCPVCGSVLVAGERSICFSCLSTLPMTNYSRMADNPVERGIAPMIQPFVAATSLCHFNKGNSARAIVHAMKFHFDTELCRYMGRLMGQDLMYSDRFDDVDYLVPVPLHWTRRISRGYNQSTLLCKGIADVFRRDVVENVLVRSRRTRKQSLQSSLGRVTNVKGAFKVRRQSVFEGKHILIVDDVLTTGATIAACCDVLSQIPNIRISVATFSIAS